MVNAYKTAFHTLMRGIKGEGMTVTYPDGQREEYGDQADRLHLWFHTARALRATAKSPSMGFGESYMAGEVTFEAGGFDELMGVMTRNSRRFAKWFRNPLVYHLVLASDARRHQRKNIHHHYDIGNDFYRLWLDKSMTYSCAYFHTENDSLERAQVQKVAHILRKLNLKKGQTLLDIGSGWGTLLITAAREYGVSGLGVTLSEEQQKYSQAAAKKAGVGHLVSFELANYQDLPARGVTYDRVVSVGMFEHVGKAGMKTYLGAVDQLLVEGGVSVLHTISTTDPHGGSDAWIDRYIFPGGYIPAIREVYDLLSYTELVPIDYESLRRHYALTLDEWRRRYQRHEKQIRADRGDDFYRMWDLYLGSCAANFRTGAIDLSQFVMTKGVVNDMPLTREYLYRN